MYAMPLRQRHEAPSGFPPGAAGDLGNVGVRVAWSGINSHELVESLGHHGLESSISEQNGESVVEIPCADDDTDRVCDDVFRRVEALIAELGLPLVAEKGDGQVFIRPPAA
jgi:hypothetical protein